MSGLVLVFDLDDTLYPERQFALSGFEAAGRWAAAELGVEGLAADMTRLLDDGHLGQLFRMALAEKMPEHSPEHLAGLLEAYRDHEPELALFDDAGWALAHFAGQAKLGLITDGTHRVQAKKVAALGIAPHFREIVFTDALGGRAFSKPHPKSYELVEAALGADGPPPRLHRRQPRQGLHRAERARLDQHHGASARAPPHPRRRPGRGRRRAAAHHRLAHRAARRARAVRLARRHALCDIVRQRGSDALAST